MIEGPFPSQSLACDGHFTHLVSIASPSSSDSSALSSSSSLSPLSSSFSSITDSPPDITLKNNTENGSYKPSRYSSALHRPSPHSSVVISNQKAPPTPTYSSTNLELDTSPGYTPARSWPRGGTSDVAARHAVKLRSQALSTQPLPKEQLQNPRRTNRLVDCQDKQATGRSDSSGCPLAPPALVRQSDRKVNFVDNLVDTAAQIVEAIWPSPIVFKDFEPPPGRVLPLRTFIQETLRRSRTSYSTLQVALYYLFVIKPFVPFDDGSAAPSDLGGGGGVRALQCGRRMFLAALILASKYLQDRNYSARAWSKISGLGISEINTNELSFLAAVNWRLHISDCIFDKWTKIVLKCTPAVSIIPPKPVASDGHSKNKWVRILSRLDLTLDHAVLDDILKDETPEIFCDRSLQCRGNAAPVLSAKVGVSGSYAASTDRAGERSPRTSSLAFALSRPISASPLESMPPRKSQTFDDRSQCRPARKSSLSVCETIDVDMKSSSCAEIDDYSLKVYAEPPRFNAARPTTYINNNIPQSKSSPWERMPSVPANLSAGENTPAFSLGNRKRGNEHSAAARHQKKKKEKIGEEVVSPKLAGLAQSGLTPQMRQMNTSFSVKGKKGNGLRLNMNTRPNLIGDFGSHSRPNPGQRTASNAVYG